MSKEHVGMGYALCPVCCTKHDEVVLVQKAFDAPARLNRENFMGWKMCAEHQKQLDEGYVFLVAVNNAEGSNIKLENADRTGDVVAVRSEKWPLIFKIPVPEGKIAFCGLEVVIALKEKMG